MADPKTPETPKTPEIHEAKKLTKRPVQIHFPKNAPLVAPTDFYSVMDRAYAVRNGVKASANRLLVQEIHLIAGVGVGFTVNNKSEGKSYQTERIVPWAAIAGADFEP